MEYIIEHTLTADTRETIRYELINLFLKERSGLDIDSDGTRPTYKYIVENLSPYIIYLKRPAYLNKGFDFIVNVENMYFKNGDKKKHRNPSHEDIINILLWYKNNNPKFYPEIQQYIQMIYNCQNIDISLTNRLPPFINYNGERIPIILILYCVKWLFIEQDITYWNYSGRNMLFSYLVDAGLIGKDINAIQPTLQ